MREMILSASVLIGFLALLRRMLRGRIDPRIQYALWLLAAARLLIPGSLFTAPVSIAGAAEELERAVQVRTDAPPETGGVFAPEGAHPVQSAPGGLPSAPGRAERNWPDLVWKAGMWAMAGAVLLSNFHFFLTLRTRRRELGIRCGPLRIYAVKGLASPCLSGVLRPAVYLTGQAAEAEHLDYVLAHEYTHFRHGDHLWALLRSVCLIVHWYNPLVWWAALLSRRDCELACDAGAIARLGEDRRLDYGQTLLRLVPAGRGSLLCAATTMTAGKRSLKERVALIARRPRMLKITLALVVPAVCAAAALAFGGAAEQPETPPEAAGEPPRSGAVTPAEPPAITEEEALVLYARAREAWSWFDQGTMPLAGETYEGEQGTLNRVEGFDSLEELRTYLLGLFSPEIADYLLRWNAVPMEEHGGRLYQMAADRPSDLNAGEETVTAFVYTPEEAEEYGYAVHIFAQTEVLDNDLETVLGYKRHDFFAAWNGSEYVFTNFGPWDDVDIQLYHNAREISTLLASGADAGEWLPLMAYMDWGALGAAGGGELCEAVNAALYRLVQERGAELTMAEYLYILSATEGLDGAFSEGFQVIVYDLYTRNPSQFAYVVLEELPEAQRNQALDCLRWELAYHREDYETPTREEAASQLEADLGAGVGASPLAALLTAPGQTFQFLPVNAYGIYAASYASADPEVAEVDQAGTVTAVGPGETTITLHYEGAGGQQDFTCAVSCRW